MERSEKGKKWKNLPIVIHRHLGDLPPCPCCCILGLGCYSESKDSEIFKVKKTKHPLLGRERKGTTASPWERVRVNKTSQHLPVCLPSSLCRLRPRSRQKMAPWGSWAAPGALAPLLKTGQVTLCRALVTAAVFPSQFCFIPCSNPMLIAGAKKLKYQPAW